MEPCVFHMVSFAMIQNVTEKAEMLPKFKIGIQHCLLFQFFAKWLYILHINNNTFLMQAKKHKIMLHCHNCYSTFNLLVLSVKFILVFILKWADLILGKQYDIQNNN